MAVDMAAIQTYVYGRLVARNVAAGRIYEEVPFDVTTGDGPYVEFVDGLDLDEDVSLSSGIEHLMTLNVWDEQPSALPIKRIVQTIRTALHAKSFPVADMDCISWVDSAQYFKPSDGTTRQAVVRLRIICRT